MRASEGDEAVLVTAQEIVFSAAAIIASEAGNAYANKVLGNAGNALKRIDS